MASTGRGGSAGGGERARGGPQPGGIWGGGGAGGAGCGRAEGDRVGLDRRAGALTPRLRRENHGVVRARRVQFAECRPDGRGVRDRFQLHKAEALPVFGLAETEEAYQTLAEANGWKLGELVHPTRLALTGKTVSPGLFDVMMLLGKEKTLERIEKAIFICKQ